MNSNFNRRIKSYMGSIAAATGVYTQDFRSKMIVTAFHRVNDELQADALTCSSAKFKAFCEFFMEHFRVVSLSEQVAGCRAGKDMGGTLSITFDDGYLDNYIVAAPILRELGLPATFFITTGFIGTDETPFWDKGLAIHQSWMKWEHVRALAAQGFDIGSHTVTHIDMGSADLDEISSELLISKQRLEQELGKAVDLFAYPFGGVENITERSLELVRQMGFTCCVSCHGGTNQPIADPYGLKRIGIAQWFESPHQLGVEIILNKV